MSIVSQIIEKHQVTRRGIAQALRITERSLWNYEHGRTPKGAVAVHLQALFDANTLPDDMRDQRVSYHGTGDNLQSNGG